MKPKGREGPKFRPEPISNPNTGMATPRTAENPRTLSSLKGLAVIQFSSRNWWERVEVELIDALTLTNLAFPIKEITIGELN